MMMKFLAGCLGLLITAALQSQVMLADPALFNNGEKWKAKSAFLRKGNDLLHKTSLGPFTTSSLEKGERQVLSYDKESFLRSSSDGSGLVKKTRQQVVQPYRLTIAGEGDTVLVTINLLVLEEAETTILNLSKKQPANGIDRRVYCREIIVQQPADSLTWTWLPGNPAPNGDAYGQQLMMLSNKGDTLVVAYASQKAIKKNEWMMSGPDGLAFSYNGHQLAYVKNTYPQTVWLKQGMEKPVRAALAAVIISVLSMDGVLPQQPSQDN